MDARSRPPADVTIRSRQRLWIVHLLVWCLGAFLSHWVGIWVGIGSASVALGGWVLADRNEGVRQRLRPTVKTLVLGIAAGLAMAWVTQGLFPLVLRYAPAVEVQTAALYVAFGPVTPLKVTVMLLVICGEELVWRGAVQQHMARYVGRKPAVVLTAVLYAAAHLPVGSPLLAAVALCCGLYFSLLAAVSGSLLAPLLTHAIWDVAVLIVWPLLRV